MKMKKAFIICGSIAAALFVAVFGGALYLVDYAVAPEDGTLCYESKNFSISEKVEEIKKILMNISIRETTKKEWKMFFLEHDLSMTQGIETAVEYLMSEVNKNNIKLSKGGITK